MPVYLKCETIGGDVTATGYDGCIRLDSAKFNIGHKVDESVSGYGADDKDIALRQIVAGYFVVTKEMDSSAASVLNAVVKATEDDMSVIFLGMSPATGADVKFLEYELAGCRVVDYAMESDAEGKVIETLSIYYKKITLKYTGRNKVGLSAGREIAVYDRSRD